MVAAAYLAAPSAQPLAAQLGVLDLLLWNRSQEQMVCGAHACRLAIDYSCMRLMQRAVQAAYATFQATYSLLYISSSAASA